VAPSQTESASPTPPFSSAIDEKVEEINSHFAKKYIKKTNERMHKISGSIGMIFAFYGLILVNVFSFIWNGSKVEQALRLQWSPSRGERFCNFTHSESRHAR
jgi:hypothetical protein